MRHLVRRALALAAFLTLLVGVSGRPALAASLTAPPSFDKPPVGWRLSAEQAITIARRSHAFQSQRERRGELAASAYMAPGKRWQVGFFAGRREVAQVHVDDRSGRIVEQWTGYQVAWSMARGYPGAFGRVVNAPYVWLPLCLLFLLPFVDLRRPLRPLHFDLLAVLAFGVSHFFFNRGEIGWSVPLAYGPLVWLALRATWLAARPSCPRGRLIPVFPLSVLALGLVVLVAFRVALNVLDSNVIDVGYASVVGADRIADGRPLYDPNFAPDIDHGDTYGSFTYLAYVPFEQALPWSGRWDELPAAHAAALAFDLLTLVALMAVGWRIAGGDRRRRSELALALGWAWASCPYAAFVVQSNSNDGLVAALIALALLAATGRSRSPATLGRSLFAALAVAAKFAPAVAAPALIVGQGERRKFSLALGGIFAATVVGALLVAFLPDGGWRALWERTVGYQADRLTPFSIYGQVPTLEPLRTALTAIAGLAAAVLAFVPKRRDLATLAALVTLSLVLVQLAAGYWFYLYVAWFLPAWLIAVIGPWGRGGHLRTAERLSYVASGAATRSIERARPSPFVSTSTPCNHGSSSVGSKRA
ncbi:glycosyltransferase 87 family protein [Thermoleophilum album]|uniref:glycosyltransferase 87 family protein n=1 Tax=Thermoleophilum album TaxID=29539 RepID=UPI00115FCF09|nr:glycosyltransferase 87 family protein [Thermoleophilum album]